MRLGKIGKNKLRQGKARYDTSQTNQYTYLPIKQNDKDPLMS